MHEDFFEDPEEEIVQVDDIDLLVDREGFLSLDDDSNSIPEEVNGHFEDQAGLRKAFGYGSAELVPVEARVGTDPARDRNLGDVREGTLKRFVRVNGQGVDSVLREGRYATSVSLDMGDGAEPIVVEGYNPSFGSVEFHPNWMGIPKPNDKFRRVLPGKGPADDGGSAAIFYGGEGDLRRVKVHPDRYWHSRSHQNHTKHGSWHTEFQKLATDSLGVGVSPAAYGYLTNTQVTAQPRLQDVERQITELCVTLGYDPMRNKDHAFVLMEALSRKYDPLIRLVEVASLIDVVARQETRATQANYAAR